MTDAAFVGGAGVATGVISGVGTILGGVFANKISKENAKYMRWLGKKDVLELRRQSGLLIGAQIATRGAQGVTMGGSSLDVLLATAGIEEERAKRLQFSVAAAVANERFRGRMALATSVGKAGSQVSQSLLSGASMMAGAPGGAPGGTPGGGVSTYAKQAGPLSAPTQFQHHSGSSVLGAWGPR